MNHYKKILAEKRYSLTRYQVYQSVEKFLTFLFKKPIRLTSIDSQALRDWQKNWVQHNDRYPPEGGWDWNDEITKLKRTTPERFEVAIWHHDKLCGLAIGKPSKGTSHNAIYLMEGSPLKHPLNALVTKIVIEVGIAYALALEKEHLILVDPLEKMIKVYTKRYGFEFRTAKNHPKRFCIKKVSI
ncbi:hypothetical protein QUF54_03245 [Candidatus Marithioploca araucensis]|uniref:N-acetyltransferase domain-containing protein n=1 Tax=Candidatus Marithioploca araucensis TaxID=70273 RepID=A0ABT7VRP7_9GAMM|nr:hypothetical protein [Candidatus Marithioploca araucensis]